MREKLSPSCSGQKQELVSRDLNAQSRGCPLPSPAAVCVGGSTAAARVEEDVPCHISLPACLQLSTPFIPFIPASPYLPLRDSLTWVHTVRVTGVCEKSLESGNSLLKGRCLKSHIDSEICSLTFRWEENMPNASIATICKQNNRTTQQACVTDTKFSASFYVQLQSSPFLYHKVAFALFGFEVRI